MKSKRIKKLSFRQINGNTKCKAVAHRDNDGRYEARSFWMKMKKKFEYQQMSLPLDFTDKCGLSVFRFKESTISLLMQFFERKTSLSKEAFIAESEAVNLEEEEFDRQKSQSQMPPMVFLVSHHSEPTIKTHNFIFNCYYESIHRSIEASMEEIEQVV